MKKLIIVLVIILLGILAIYIATHKGKQAGEIRIGAILPLTGGAGKYGEDAKLAIDLAVEEQNAKGGVLGKKIKVLYEDDQSIPQQSVSAFRKVVSQYHVPVIIGGMTSSSALAIAPLAEKYRVVLLSPSASTPALTEAGDYVFRNEVSDAYGASEEARLIWQYFKFKRIAIIYINNDYGLGVKDAFSKTYSSLGGQVVDVETFEADAQDFRTQLSRIKQAAPDAIFVVAYKEVIPILRQIKELGLTAKILSTPVFEDADVLAKLKDVAEGVIYAFYGSFNPKSERSNIKKFVDAFSKKYHRSPGYYSALAYDAANIVFLAIQKGGYNSEGIKEALYRIKNFPGVTGETSFDSNGDVVKPVILKEVKNGKFVEFPAN